jgi:SPP1 gp7 family putative phage head morphogenesis protein
VARFKGDAEIEALLYEPSVLADLAGQMFVRLVEMPDDGAERHLADDPRPAFLRLAFAEAVEFWRSRGGDPAMLDEVLAAYRRRAATASDEQLDTIARRAVEEIQRTLESGGTLADFKRDIESQAVTLGIAPAGPGYLENVYRTQVASAYGAGRYAQLTNSDVIAARPYRQYRTAQDSRVRTEHVVMDGVTWRADDATFAQIYPPCGFQCRCAVVSLSQEDIDDEGLTVVTAIPAGFVLTAGFGASSFVR